MAMKFNIFTKNINIIYIALGVGSVSTVVRFIAKLSEDNMWVFGMMIGCWGSFSEYIRVMEQYKSEEIIAKYRKRLGIFLIVVVSFLLFLQLIPYMFTGGY